ncbi:hypothetical protein QR680_013109 [Steinernema hermaphroditum]|uniref:Transmembrane protein n=1 Tax=Steinernema hermaphroditum TaxID=289476 RepID=A0AA39I6F6_9BILA|nr:hypothetical protein QR680_013109 [Steinernema hermaphroditum]
MQLCYAFSAEKDFVFQRFNLFGVQIGIWAVFFLFFHGVAGLLKLHTDVQLILHMPCASFALVSVASNAAMLIAVPFGLRGVFAVREKYISVVFFAALFQFCAGLCGSVSSILLQIPKPHGYRPQLPLVLGFCALIPMQLLSLLIFFRFLRFARAFAVSEEVSESEVVAALRFFRAQQNGPLRRNK